jgi:endonuclease-3
LLNACFFVRNLGLRGWEITPVINRIQRRSLPKQAFSISRTMKLVRAAVAPYPKAALFELAEEGFRSPFEQLVACILSVRTRDETTLVAARRLFDLARTPLAMSQLTSNEINTRISATTFHEAKAHTLHAMARRIVSEFSGQLPCDREVLLSLHGVGPKCANLVMGIACDQPHIAVDIHVHRVTNRWGYVQTRNPEVTLAALEAKLPKRYWVEINALLVPFGKHICTGTLPKCSTCPVLKMCRQVGVMAHR